MGRETRENSPRGSGRAYVEVRVKRMRAADVLMGIEKREPFGEFETDR